MAYNKNILKINNKYRSKFEFISLRVEQGERDKIAKHAEKHGESMNAFINRAIKETLKRDK